MIYWLKTKTDIDASNYAYDSLCFPLDTNGTDLDLDNPTRRYQVNKIIGNGATISGGDTFGDRAPSFKMMFKTDGVGTSGALTAGRLAFISKYIVSRDDIYLIRDYNGTLQYIKVVPTMGAEKYKKYVTSSPFEIKLLCSLPFFKNVTATVVSFTKSSRYQTEDITNTGIMTPFIFQGTFSANDTVFKISVYENAGLQITNAFTGGDILKFDTASFRIWVNNVERFNIPVLGTPFNLLSGANAVKLESISAMTSCTITYTGRNI
jgi:hypothetical protein